jgi:hypothetical protein
LDDAQKGADTVASSIFEVEDCSRVVVKCLTVVVVNNSFCELKCIEEVSSVVLVDLMVVSTVET